MTKYTDLCARLEGMDGDRMSIKTLEQAAAAIRELEALVEAARNDALREAAKLVDRRHRGNLPEHIKSEDGNAIRALIGGEE